jgi:hypothetical protein
MAKRFNVTVYDRTVKTFSKVFEAETEEEARSMADDEGVDDEGWIEHYEELFSEQHIESIEELDEDTDADMEISE